MKVWNKNTTEQELGRTSIGVAQNAAGQGLLGTSTRENVQIGIAGERGQGNG